MAQLELLVTGMTCEHCEHAVTAELSAIDGVDVLDADAATGIVRIEHAAPLDPAVLAAAIQEAGYTLSELNREADA